MGTEQSTVTSIIDLDNFVIDKDTRRIGYGTEGVVYTNLQHLNIAVKKSIQRNVCRKWEMEAKMQQHVYDTFHTLFRNHDIQEYINIPRIYKMEENNELCYIVMDRVIPIYGDPQDLSNLQGRAVHANFDHENYCDDLGPVGLSVGKSLISKVIDIEKLMGYLGIFLAHLQYNLGYDAHDLEYILGMTAIDKKVKLYVIDYGKMGHIQSRKDYFKGFEPGIPYREPLFEKYYVREAHKYGKGKFALRVLGEMAR